MRRLQPFRAGQPLRELRQPLNRIVSELNRRELAAAGSQGSLEGFRAHDYLLLEIKTLNPANLTCVLPEQTLQPGVDEYTVELPQTFNEASRDGVTYTYTDINNRTADGTEIQKLTPIYLINDLIVAASCGNVDASPRSVAP